MRNCFQGRQLIVGTQDERADETKESLGMQEWKNQILAVLPSHPKCYNY